MIGVESDTAILRNAKEVFEIESSAIMHLGSLLTSDFEEAVKQIINCKGKVIISGMGKSGIIGKKIAATFASTGSPSFFMHPGEAYHGDLGMISSDDIFVAISNSGETGEMLQLIPFLKENNNIIISITGVPGSTLAINSHYHLNVHVDKEACPLQLAPTASTTATLAMGDALAVVLMKERNFQLENFARFHPGGSLGKKLLTKVQDIMVSDNLPIVKKEDGIKKVIQVITSSALGQAVVVENNIILGIISDGDLRRAMTHSEEGFFKIKAQDIMTINPKIVCKGTMFSDAEDLMLQNKINSLLVADNGMLVGIVQIYGLNNR